MNTLRNINFFNRNSKQKEVDSLKEEILYLKEQLNPQQRRNLVAAFINERDYESMDTKTFISELNRFLDGNLR